MLMANFEKDRPAIFGALLDMMVYGLRALPSVNPRQLPRMADFATWAIACEGAKWPEGAFEEAYRINRAEVVDTVVNADPVALTVQELMARTLRTMRTQISQDGVACGEWKGTASDLLRELRTIASESLQTDGNWPKSAHALANRLRRATPFLRECGIDITHAKEGHDRKRMIHIRLHGECGKSPSASSAREPNRLQTGADISILDDAEVEEGEVVAVEKVDASPLVSSSPASLWSAGGVNSPSADPPKPKRIVIRRPEKKD